MVEIVQINEEILEKYDDFIKLRNAIETVAFNERDDGEELYSTMKDEYYCYYAYQTIICASLTRPFSWKYLTSLWKSLKHKPIETLIKDNIHSPFINYLYHNGTLNEFSNVFKGEKCDHEKAKRLENGYDDETVEIFIKYDDIEAFKRLAAEPLFDLSMNVNISELCKKVDLLTFASYYGATKCFKFLVMNNCLNIENKKKMKDIYYIKTLCSSAIKGGNYEILHIIKQSNISFLQSTKSSVKYHRIDIENWILCNFGFENVPLTTCYRYCNTLSFFFFYEYNPLIDQKTKIGGYPLLMLACMRNDIDFVDFLIEKGANIEITDNSLITPLICSSENGFNDIVMYLISKGANIEAMDCFSKTSLIRAAFAGMTETVHILIENGANIEAKDSTIQLFNN